jgi:hypothetical protein
MISQVYPDEWQIDDDLKISRLMGARSIIKALEHVGITDPPRNQEEFDQAWQVFLYHIANNQPNALTPGISLEEACRLAPHIGGNARGIIYQWAYYSLTKAASGDLQQAAHAIPGIWETACHFSDDLFKFGVKLAFGVGAYLLTYPQARLTISSAAWTVLGIYYAEVVPERVRRHNYESFSLGTNLFLILQLLTDPQKVTSLGLSVSNVAREADHQTASALRLEAWVNDYLSANQA